MIGESWGYKMAEIATNGSWLQILLIFIGVLTFMGLAVLFYIWDNRKQKEKRE